MFRQKVVPTSELISTPTPRPVAQSWEFRVPEHREIPTWWEGSGCGECAGGGGFHGQNVIHQYWRNYHDDGDPFTVQNVAEDLIVGSKVRRHERLEPRVVNEYLNAVQTDRLIAALTRAKTDLFG